MRNDLPSWHDTPTQQAILDFVAAVTDETGPQYVPPVERIAAFDNDGTLWCEKPMYIQLDFIYVQDESGGAIEQKAELDVIDDGPGKPVQIWNVTGRRPILAAGNANGDLEMLSFTGGPSLPALRLLVLHDDARREFDYIAGAEKVLDAAQTHGWNVVSMQRDWREVFPG